MTKGSLVALFVIRTLSFLRPSALVIRHSADESNRKWIAIKLSLARFYRCDYDEHGVQHPEANQNGNANQDDTENRRNRVIDQHRNLKIQRFFSIRIDLRRVATFHEPNDKRPQEVAQEMKEQSE
jgi:hypothetical protein